MTELLLLVNWLTSIYLVISSYYIIFHRCVCVCITLYSIDVCVCIALYSIDVWLAVQVFGTRFIKNLKLDQETVESARLAASSAVEKTVMDVECTLCSMQWLRQVFWWVRNKNYKTFINCLSLPWHLSSRNNNSSHIIYWCHLRYTDSQHNLLRLIIHFIYMSLPIVCNTTQHCLHYIVSIACTILLALPALYC